MKAAIVAAELRKLADALDVQPDADIVKPWLTFYAYEKTQFLATARLMPRPLKKKVDTYGDTEHRRLRLDYISDGLDIGTSIPQHLTCELVEPAKPAVFRCAPILSEEEDAAMEMGGIQ